MTTTNVQDIGYAFLKTYYQRMHTDPSKLFHFYSSTAELTHINYQVGLNVKADTLPTVKVIGKENISKFYSRNNKMVQDVRVKIDACDFQSTGANNNGVLILALGEICWSNTPSYRFCQTFVLNPVGSNNAMYDVTNDIIRFIPDALKEVVPQALDSGSSEAVAQTGKHVPAKDAMGMAPSCNEREAKDKRREHKREDKKEEKKEVKREAKREEKHEKESKEEHYAARESVEENKEEKKEEPKDQKKVSPSLEKEKGSPPQKEAKASDKPAPEVAKAETKTTPPAKNTDEGKNDAKAEQPAQEKETKTQDERHTIKKFASDAPKKMNWATQLTNSDSKAVPNVTTNYTRVPPETAKLPERRGSPNGNVSKSNSKKLKYVSVPNKDGFYPVYIRNTGAVTNKELTDTLEREFGVVKKISAQDSFAVVDFEDPQCQQDAIRMNSLKINNTTVYMEPKTEKKRGPSSSVSASTSPTSINGNRSNKKHSNRRKD